jgi:hypothetical protein
MSPPGLTVAQTVVRCGIPSGPRGRPRGASARMPGFHFVTRSAGMTELPPVVPPSHEPDGHPPSGGCWPPPSRPASFWPPSFGWLLPPSVSVRTGAVPISPATQLKMNGTSRAKAVRRINGWASWRGKCHRTMRSLNIRPWPSQHVVGTAVVCGFLRSRRKVPAARVVTCIAGQLA